MRKKGIGIIVLIGLFMIVSFFIWSTTISGSRASQLVYSSTDNQITTPGSHNKISVIIFSSKKLYCYLNDDINGGRNYQTEGENTFRIYLVNIKEKYGDSLVVLIKPTATASYRSTIDVLDEISVNAIKQFSVVDLSETEKQKFSTGSLFQPPASGEIQTPKSVSSTYEIEGLLIDVISADEFRFSYINKDQTTKNFYGTDISKKSIEAKIDSAIVIAGDRKKLKVMIRAHENLKYTEYENILEALKAKDIYNYKLISIPK